MIGRAFNFAAVLSSLLLVGVLVLWTNADAIDPTRHRISLGPYFHVSAVSRRGGIDARLAVFNDPEGPYRGSILSLEKDPTLDIEEGFGDTAGIYYRYFHWTDGGELWSLLVSLAYPIIAFSVLPSFLLIRKIRVRHQLSRPNAAMDL